MARRNFNGGGSAKAGNPRSPSKLQGSLAGRALADKIGFLWLNTELRGYRATVLGTM